MYPGTAFPTSSARRHRSSTSGFLIFVKGDHSLAGPPAASDTYPTDMIGRLHEPLPAHDLQLHAGYVIGRLHRVLARELREMLRPYHLSLPAYTALSVLRRRPGLSNAELARRSLITPQAMNELIARLLDCKLVVRRVDSNHNRILQTRLTARGERLMEQCETETRELEQRMLAGIPDSDQLRLLEMLRTCVHNLGAGL